jgi:hypothetical protein
MKTVFGKVAATFALCTTLGLSAQTWNPVEWHAAASDTASADFYKTLLPTVEEAVSAGKFDPSLFTEVKGLDNVKPTESVRVYFVSGEKGPDAWKGYRALFTGDGSLLGGEYTYSEGESKVRSGDFAEFAGSEKAAYQEGGFAAAGGGTGAEWFGTIKGSSSYNASVYEIAGTGLSLLSFNLNGANMALVFSTAAITTPEPGTYAIMAGCLGLGVWMTRRRNAPSKA